MIIKKGNKKIIDVFVGFSLFVGWEEGFWEEKAEDATVKGVLLLIIGWLSIV